MSKPRKAKRARTNPTTRSIWNSKDDWDTLVAESQLSTSSISSRRPPPAGVESLTSCCAQVAGRAFKRLWELDQGMSWKYAWDGVPDRLKLPVREEVFGHWGAYLTTNMISEVFIFPRSVLLPAKSLPTVASTERLIPFRPALGEGFTRLSLTHAPKASDTAIAGLIHSMPELEEINLKGCTLAGSRTVDIICKRCKGLKRLNMKGTNLDELQVREIMDTYGKQLEVLKVDRLVIEAPDETFIQDSYPNIKKLCLPGDVFQTGSAQFRRQSIQSGYTIPWPAARPYPPGARFRWDTLGTFFPSLTHLALPGAFVPPLTQINIKPNTLVKLDLGPGGPPVPISVLSDLLKQHMSTIQYVRFGSLSLIRPDDTLVPLFWTLAQCTNLKTLEIELDSRGTESQWMKDWVDWMYLDIMRSGELSGLEMGLLFPPKCDRENDPPKLKKLRINAKSTKPFVFDDFDLTDTPLLASLQELHIPSINVSDPEGLAKDLAHYKGLRVLDVSGIGFSEEDIFAILDSCPNLHTVDLTSCRGIKVQNRRNIFKVWEEARAPPSIESALPLGRGGRRKRVKK